MNEKQRFLFIGYPRCSTSNKAQKWLDANGIPYTFRHIKDERPTAEELKQWHAASGMPLKKFFNSSGMLYKEMKLKDQLPTMSQEDQYELLASDGMLVKRPLLIGEGIVLAGFREKDWVEKLEK